MKEVNCIKWLNQTIFHKYTKLKRSNPQLQSSDLILITSKEAGEAIVATLNRAKSQVESLNGHTIFGMRLVIDPLFTRKEYEIRRMTNE